MITHNRLRPIRSFVVRQGRMSPAQKRAIDELYPRFGLNYQPAVLDLDPVFGRKAPHIVEIGFGMGMTTAEIAANHPEQDFVGIEVHPPGVGSLLNLIQQRNLTNLKIIQHDAVEVLQHMIAPDSLDGVHIFFPDPWHKARHHKRRLIQPAFAQLVADRLKPGGYLHCATDWEHYAEHMLQVLSAVPSLVNTCESYASRPAWRPLTKFENRGLSLGHGIFDLIFRRSAPAETVTD